MEGDINAPSLAPGEVKHQSPPESPGITGEGVPTVPVSAANNPAPRKEPPTTVAETAVIPSTPVIRQLVSLSAALRAKDDLEDVWDRGGSSFSASAPPHARWQHMEIPRKPSRRHLTQPPPVRLTGPCGPRSRRGSSRRLEALETPVGPAEGLPVLSLEDSFVDEITMPAGRLLTL